MAFEKLLTLLQYKFAAVKPTGYRFTIDLQLHDKGVSAKIVVGILPGGDPHNAAEARLMFKRDDTHLLGRDLDFTGIIFGDQFFCRNILDSCCRLGGCSRSCSGRNFFKLYDHNEFQSVFQTRCLLRAPRMNKYDIAFFARSHQRTQIKLAGKNIISGNLGFLSCRLKTR